MFESTISRTLRPKHRREGAKRKLNGEALLDDETRTQFQKKLNEALVNNPIDPQYDPETNWLRMANTVRNTAEEVMGFKKKRHRDWFDENRTDIRELIARKNRAHDALQNNPSSIALR